MLGLEAGELGLGDPAMLLPYLANALDWPVAYRSWRPPKSERVALIPNLRQLSRVGSWPGFPWRDRNIRIVSPYLPWHEVLRLILGSDRVIATSLHGLILAEAFGVPVTWTSVPPLEEGTFKFRDYFSSTGRLVDVRPPVAAIDELLDDDWFSGTAESTGFDFRSSWNPRLLWNAFPWAEFHRDAPAFPDPQGGADSVDLDGSGVAVEPHGRARR
jgi:pyruvyltransferase